MTEALAVIEPDRFPVLADDSHRLQEAMRENLGPSAEFKPSDFTQIRVPTGGQTSFMVPTISGEMPTPELEGIVIHVGTPRAYWKASFDETGGSTLPDCYSDDGVVGIGEPGGDCAVCPMDEFGSDARGRGKACGERILLFMMREHMYLPTCVSVPAGSLVNVRKYLKDLVGYGTPISTVLTRLALEVDKNQDGIKYSKIVATSAGPLDEESIAKVRTFAESIRPYLVRATRAVDESDT